MKISVFLLFLICVGQASSQNFVDLANIYWRTSPSNKTDITGELVNFNTWAFDAKAPVVLSDKTTLIFGVDLANNRISNSTSGDEWIFSSATLQMGIEKKWPNFKTLCMLMPKISSTFTGGLDAKDFQIGGITLNTLKRSDRFDWRFGAYVNSELFNVMIVPLFGFNWKINDAWRLKMLLPVNLEVSRIMNDKWIAGFLFVGANASYRMRGQINPNTTYPGNYQPYMDKADNNGWFYSDIYLTKNLVLNFKAGHSVLRKYRLYDEDDKLDLKLGPVNLGNDRYEASVLMKNGFSFEARMIFRLPL